MSARLRAAALLLVPVLASAQDRPGLVDPTRPPAEAMQYLSPGMPVQATMPGKPVLQSVLVGRGHEGRELAVIDGVIVRKGEKFRGAVLVEVRPNEVLLRRGTQTEKLVLFPLAAGSRKK
ncbi:MAG: hypothetical protein K0R43_3806 [Pseudoduganella sp.]|nr:hypothetical protein [Pseudoduganella sp.]